MEISQEIIAHAEPEIKLNLADDVMRLLNVRERNAEMAKDWLIFIATSNFKITAGEIYLAFKMALSREILDDKGNEIDLFPELSNNTTGKVISAYLRFKKESQVYQLHKERLKSLKTPEKEFSEEEKLKLREELLQLIFNDIKNTGFSSDAWHLYFDLSNAGKINKSKEEKKKLLKEETAKYEAEEKARIRAKYSTKDGKIHIAALAEKLTAKKPLASITNRCRSIVTSEYLKDFVTDFETFKKACHEPL